MKRYFSIISILILISLLTAGFKPFTTTDYSKTDLITITASGQWCNSEGCGAISFSFNPAGGPVSGSASGTTFSYATDGTVLMTHVVNLNLSGTFQGGDGGNISGTMTGQEESACPTCVDGDKTYSMDGWNWNGILYANGTGKGGLTSAAQWNVTFSAQQFQEGLGSSASPTMDSTQSNPPLEQATAGVPISPTVGDTQSSQNQALPILPSIQAAIQSQPTVDMAAEEILNQDGAIIARDAQGVFYAVSNEGVKKVLPQELQDRVSQDFFFLWNVDLIYASPAIKALIAKDSTTSPDNISGANTYYVMPSWLKERDYQKLNTKCTDDTCRSELSMPAMLGTSWGFDDEGFDLSILAPPQEALASSEHASIRGTINGSGDFIYAPQVPQQNLLAALVTVIKPDLLADSSNYPYLGLQTNADNNGVVIRLVQKGSPAEKAGLAIGDVILKVNKIAVDAKNTLASLISQHKAGEQVELEITRNGHPILFTVKLAQILPSIIITSAAEITLADSTRLVIDTAFNGINGIYVREGQAHVREPISGSEVDVQAGQAVIVVPGYPIDAPLTLSNEQIHDPFAKSSQSSSTETTIEFPLWYLIAILAVIIILIVVLVVFLNRRSKARKENNIPIKSKKKTTSHLNK